MVRLFTGRILDIKMENIEKYNCDKCGDIFELNEGEAPATYHNSEIIICDDCYEELYEDICPLCENLYDKPERPTDGYFYASHESGLVPGFYHVLDYPVFIAATGGIGDTRLINDNFELIKEKILDVDFGAEFCCSGCALNNE